MKTLLKIVHVAALAASLHGSHDHVERAEVDLALLLRDAVSRRALVAGAR